MSIGWALWFYAVGGITHLVVSETAFGSLWLRFLVAAAIATTGFLVYEWLRTRA